LATLPRPATNTPLEPVPAINYPQLRRRAGRQDGKIIMTSLDSFKCLRPLKVGSKTYAYYSLPVAEKNGLKARTQLTV
jgi:hypothetical protein